MILQVKQSANGYATRRVEGHHRPLLELCGREVHAEDVLLQFEYARWTKWHWWEAYLYLCLAGGAKIRQRRVHSPLCFGGPCRVWVLRGVSSHALSRFAICVEFIANSTTIYSDWTEMRRGLGLRGAKGIKMCSGPVVQEVQISECGGQSVPLTPHWHA